MSRTLKAAKPAGHTGSSSPEVRATVENIIDDIRLRGDDAVREYSGRFDNWSPESFRLSQDEIASIISSGTAARTPDVTYIWSHGGGSIWAQRYISANDLANPTDPKSKMYHLRRFYYDTAAANDSLHMGILKLAIPISQVLFGSDYPWGSAAASTAR